MNVSEKLTKIAQNEQLVADANAELEEALYSKSEGGKSWYDKYAETISIHPEKTVSGSYISANDVSELPHSVKCRVTGVDNPENVTVTRCGKNLLNPDNFRNGEFVEYNGIQCYKYRDNATYFVYEGDFIPNTQYTLSFKLYAEDGNTSLSTGIYVEYTDGTNSKMNVFGEREHSLITDEGKTVVRISGAYNNNRVLYIDLSYTRLSLGTTAFPYEPYTAQTLTPSAEGIVEGMASISPQMNIFTDNADAMLDVTYRISAGKKEEYDRFWDTFQWNGRRKFYQYAFAFGWDDDSFNPKYPLTGISQVTYMCYYSSITNVAVDIEITDNANSLFSQCSTLHTVKKLIVRENVPYSNSFYNCIALANITFEGVIGQSISFQYSPLTKASITNVIEHLSSTASGQTCTFKKTAKEAAFTASEWDALISTKSNWTISLV